MLRTHPVLGFFVLTFAISWGVWIPAGALFPDKASTFVLVGAWAPAFAAVLLTLVSDGPDGLGTLLGRLVKWRTGLRWYIVAIAGPAVAAMIAIAVDTLLGGSAPTLEITAGRFGLPAEHPRWIFALLPFIYIATVIRGGPIPEELGWRGFAHARLQRSSGAAVAGAMVGVVWSLWRLPLFYLLPAVTGGIPFLYYVPLMTASGVLLGWMYRRTDSVLLCVLFHAALNLALGSLGLTSGAPDRGLLAVFVAVWVAIAAVAFVMLRSGETVKKPAASA